MRILTDRRWTDAFPDEHRGEGAVRIRVLAMANIETVRGLYIVRPRSVRLLANYLRELGPVEVVRKIVSRTRERHRNRKLVSAGMGEVLEADAGSGLRPGTLVAFVAPAHPACVERVVLPAGLVVPAPDDMAAGLPTGELAHLAARAQGEAWWREVAGWSPYSGVPLPGDLMCRAVALLREQDWAGAARLPISPASEIREIVPASRSRAAGRPRAVLFGYGNYAKTVCLPNIAPFVELVGVHEIDPTQIVQGDAGVYWDTAPVPRAGERFDAALVAGFHHTHAPIAVEALRRGAYAVAEKPLVTTRAQLDDLLGAVRGGGRLFACFHKRYLPFNDWVHPDLGIGPGDPVSYHCIVYEVPLPPLHWYLWPHSRSRLVSNGCHWIDHFLFLNGYAAPLWHDVHMAGDGTINCSVELANGAFFTMVLTDHGSERIGVQDHVQLRAGGVTVTITNGADYVAESSDRILRRRRINKIRSYQRMYRTIGSRIAAGAPGDSEESVRVATELMLALEEQLEAKAGSPSARRASRTGGAE